MICPVCQLKLGVERREVELVLTYSLGVGSGLSLSCRRRSGVLRFSPADYSETATRDQSHSFPVRTPR